MNPEPENYEPLRRLLSLKRQEAPPPGYFNRFADRVIARLHEPEPLAPLTWWQRFGLDFDFKPALVCGLGVVVCSLLSVGIITATQVGETEGFAGNIENPALLPLPGTAPATTASFASIPRPEAKAAGRRAKPKNYRA